MEPEIEKTLGEQELELLRWIGEQAEAVTVGQAAEQWGGERGLSRSTVVTVMERLRVKGFLTRRKQDGVFRYQTALSPEKLNGGLVQRFVEKTLAGSLSPLVAYFASARKLTPDEMTQLETLIAKLDGPSQAIGRSNDETSKES